MALKPLIINKKARQEYSLGEQFVAGLELTGPEAKSLRLKHGSLTGSYVRIVGGEAWLLNAQISPYFYARNDEYEPTRSRRLLLRKDELVKLETLQNQRGQTLVPIEIVAAGRYIKLVIALARGKSRGDRREEIKRRDLDRLARKELKWE